MTPPLTEDEGRTLVALATATVRSGLLRRPLSATELGDTRSSALDALGASFVTLERGERLLGCIGTIEPVRPLVEDVMQNAYRSAFADPRLPAVTPGDYEVMSVKVSVLSELEPIEARSFDELVAALRPGVDGVLLRAGGRRATFLPSVWPKVRDAREFVDALLRKGGFRSRGWPSGGEALRYTTEEFADPGPRALL